MEESGKRARDKERPTWDVGGGGGGGGGGVCIVVSGASRKGRQKQ